MVKEEKYTRLNKKGMLTLTIIIIALIMLFVILAIRIGRIGYRVGDLKEVSASSLNMVNIINITGEDFNSEKNTNLGIFKKDKFSNEDIIAPGSNGIYKFCIQNTTDDDVKYDIDFSDIMTDKINMKYKLKIDNIYIRGDENNYVDISELNVNEIKVLRNSNNVFTLEWCWIDDDEQDTYVGINEKSTVYTLNLSITATRIGK